MVLATTSFTSNMEHLRCLAYLARPCAFGKRAPLPIPERLSQNQKLRHKLAARQHRRGYLQPTKSGPLSALSFRTVLESRRMNQHSLQREGGSKLRARQKNFRLPCECFQYVCVRPLQSGAIGLWVNSLFAALSIGPRVVQAVQSGC